MAIACTPWATASATAMRTSILVERDQHLALGVHALADFVAQVAVDQRLDGGWKNRL